jgi:hypothetical protein
MFTSHDYEAASSCRNLSTAHREELSIVHGAIPGEESVRRRLNASSSSQVSYARADVEAWHPLLLGTTTPSSS